MMVAPEREVPGISERHCEPDLERVLPRHRVHRRHPRRAMALVPVLHREDHQRAHDERAGDRPRMEQVLLDLLLEGEADDRRRKERHEEVQGEPLLHAVARQTGEGFRESCAVFPAHGEDRAQLDHDVEDLALLVVQAEEIRYQDQVACRGNREEFGEALDDPLDDGVEKWRKVHRGVV